MQSMFLNKVCFAIDQGENLRKTKRFLKHIDNAIAMGGCMGAVVSCIGYWDGILENSYIMDERDYNKLVKAMGFVDKQECVLIIPGDVRQNCILKYNSGDTEILGPMQQVTAIEAKKLDAWTYVQGSRQYFSVKKKRK